MHSFGIKFPIGHAPSNPLAKVHGSPFEMDDFYKIEKLFNWQTFCVK